MAKPMFRVLYTHKKNDNGYFLNEEERKKVGIRPRKDGWWTPYWRASCEVAPR